MTPRLVTRALACVVLVACLGHAVGDVQVEGARATITLDSVSGAVRSIKDNATGAELKTVANPASGFRLLLEHPDRSTVAIEGSSQKLTRIDRTPGAARLTWQGPLTDSAGKPHNIALAVDVACDARGLVLRSHIKNDSGLKVRDVWYPEIGGLRAYVGKGGTLWAPTSPPREQALDAPVGTATYHYPQTLSMSFLCAQNKSEGRSLYLSCQDRVARYKSYTLQERKGPGGLAEVFFTVAFHPFLGTGKSWEGPAVVLRFVKGNWRAGGSLYRAWFAKAFGIVQPSQCWIRRQSFFLMQMFMLPEGTITMRFRDIPAWARAAKSMGINAVQISGWQTGGHDNGYPDYRIDPRLGTWRELQDGIRYCHKLGLKVYFFVNYQPVMVDSSWYKNELHRYREWTANGGLTWNTGWGMGTLEARMGLNKNMTWMELAFPEVRKIIVGHFRKLAQIGADGVHVDKMFPTAIEYNPESPLSPDTAGWEGAVRLTQEVFAACKPYSPDWAMSFECNWDRVLQFTGATWWAGNQLATRLVFPENAEMLGLYEAWDYLKVNNAVRDAHVVMVSPRYFTRGVDWPAFRDLGRYIKEVKRIQDSLKDTVFLGDLLGASGVALRGVPDAGVEYRVFRNRRTGLKVCIATNSSMSSGRIALTSFEGHKTASVRVQGPFQKARVVKLPATITVPGERIVFIEELGGGR